MLKRVVVSGILGAIVMTAWAFVANGIFLVRSRVDMNRVSDESAVHAVLQTSRYSRRVLFFAAIGLLFAVFSDMAKFDIAGYPLAAALLLGASDLVSWTLAGLAISWWLRPERSRA